MDRNKRQLSYTWSHLLPPLIMFGVICLTEDIVLPILDSCGVVVPIGALIARLVVYMHPNIGRGCDQHSRSNTGNWTYFESNTLAIVDRYGTLVEIQAHRISRRWMSLTMFFVDFGVPFMAILPK